MPNSASNSAECPSCGRRSLHYDYPERYQCHRTDCGFACEADDLLRMAGTPNADPTPAAHEARLRSMTDPDHPARSLSPRDREAVGWALEELGRLRGERDAACRPERERWEGLPAWARKGRAEGRP